jgi:hypothetical protein
MYEPVDSLHPQGPQNPIQLQQPQMQTKNDYVALASPGPRMQAQTPIQMPHQMPAPKNNSEASKAVPVPATAPAKTAWLDISDYYDLTDWGFLLTAAIVVEAVVISITRFFPAFSGKYLNLWYSRFRLSAILQDILSVLLGFGIARYVYTEYVYPNYDWSPVYFTGLAVLVQIVHDVLFYIGVVRQVPEGQNGMVDVFKKYAEATSYKAVIGDSAIMVGTSVTSMLLKAFPVHAVFIGLAAAYTIPYFMEVKNEFSVLS